MIFRINLPGLRDRMGSEVQQTTMPSMTNALGGNTSVGAHTGWIIVALNCTGKRLSGSFTVLKGIIVSVIQPQPLTPPLTFASPCHFFCPPPPPTPPADDCEEGGHTSDRDSFGKKKRGPKKKKETKKKDKDGKAAKARKRKKIVSSDCVLWLCS